MIINSLIILICLIHLKIYSIGGIVGFNNGGDGKVYLSAALSLNITSKSSGVNVGGIVGNSNNSNVDSVRFISAITKINGKDVNGILSGRHYVGGIVASATGGNIVYSSVESFIEEFFFTINNKNETSTAGIAHIGGTTVDKSFVSANLKGSKIYLTTNGTDETPTIQKPGTFR